MCDQDHFEDDREQFEALRYTVLPDLIARNQTSRRLRICGPRISRPISARIRFASPSIEAISSGLRTLSVGRKRDFTRPNPFDSL